MATQFASLTPIVRFPAPRQSVRIAYSSQSSLAAIADALSDQPTPVVEATLEELTTYVPLRELLAERNALMAGLNADTSGSDAEVVHVCNRIGCLERQIITSDAQTPEDAIVKLLTVVQIAQNHDVDEDEANNAIVAARRHFGMGFSSSLPWDAKMPMPKTYNPFMRGQWLEWQRAYSRWIDADRVARAFSDTVFQPASEAERKFWTKYRRDYDFASDPAAAAERDAVTYPKEWDEREDANWSARYDAMIALYRTPAPGPSELAVKLKVFTAEESYDLVVKDELLNGFLTDARRVGRHGAYLETDRTLLTAFADRREAMEASSVQGSMTETEEADYFRRTDRADLTMKDARASTIEGVLAKLRTAFAEQVGDSWSRLTITDPKHPDLAEGVRMGDFYGQMMWSGIEDLGRIAGIDLGGSVLPPAPSQHTAWLNERNDLLAAADHSEADVSDEEALSRINRLDNTILSTPATSADDVIAKLVMAMEVQAEGADLPTETAAALVREAKAHLGIGYVYSAEVVA